MHLLKIFLSLIIVSNLYSQSGWVRLSQAPQKIYNSIDIIDTNNIYVVTVDGYIYKSTNGGSFWVQSYHDTAGYFQDVYFVNMSTGCVVGGLLFNLLLRTTDGGLNWSNIQIGVNDDLYSLHFCNSLTGYAAGARGLVIKTTNAGLNWNILSSGIPGVFYYSVFFTDPNTGFITGWNGQIQKTTNGGSSWLTVYSSSHVLEEIYFVNGNTGFTVGSEGSFLRTSNGGSNWISIPFFSLDDYLITVYFTNPGIGYISSIYNFGYGIGLCYIFKTTNSGENWNLQYSDDSDLVIYKLKFVNDNTGFAVGKQGLILKTTTGGSIGIKKEGDIVPVKYSLYQNYPNPFNPTTTIKFDIPYTVRRSAGLPNGIQGVVVLKVYDPLGSVVATLVNGYLTPGIYKADFDASNLPSGAYFYRLQAGDYSESKKMILLK